MRSPRLIIPRKKIKEFCQRNFIQSLALFGSVLNSDFNEDSDIDILVEFEPGHTPGLLLIRMQDELSTLFGGRKVDLVTRKFLNRRILNGLKTEVIVQHGQK